LQYIISLDSFILCGIILKLHYIASFYNVLYYFTLHCIPLYYYVDFD